MVDYASMQNVAQGTFTIIIPDGEQMYPHHQFLNSLFELRIYFLQTTYYLAVDGWPWLLHLQTGQQNALCFGQITVLKAMGLTKDGAVEDIVPCS